MKILILGVNGFIGRHFARYALTQGAQVQGVVRDAAKVKTQTIPCWVSDYSAQSLTCLFNVIQPTHIVHAAGQTNPNDMTGNITLMQHLRSALLQTTCACRCLVVGSSAQYGWQADLKDPVIESAPLNPISPYGVGKATSWLMAQQMALSNEIDVVQGTIFNTLGQGQNMPLLVPRLLHTIKMAAQQAKPANFVVGAIDVYRDFLAMPDVVRGLWVVLCHGDTGQAYNICANQAYAVRDIVATICEQADVPISVVVDETQTPGGYSLTYQRGSYDKLKGLTGWSPQASLTQILHNLVEETRVRNTLCPVY